MWNRYFIRLLSVVGISLALLSCGLTTHIVTDSTTGKAAYRENKRTLTIVDYNMDHDWPKFSLRRERIESIVRELKNINPDIVFLQEASIVKGNNAADYIAERIGFNSIYARANGNDRLIGFEEGEAVITRFSVVDFNVHRLKPKPGIFENRICLRVTLDTQVGTLDVFCTHLSHKKERAALRYKQAKDLLRFIESEKKQRPVILAGDFNSKPISDVYRLVKSNGFLDAVLLFNLDRVDARTPFFTSGIDELDDVDAEPDERIDYVFLKSGRGNYRWKVSDYYGFFPNPVKLKYNGKKIPVWISDHVGIVLRVKLTKD